VELGNSQDGDKDATCEAESHGGEGVGNQLEDHDAGDLTTGAAHGPEHAQLPHGVFDVGRDCHHQLESSQDEANGTCNQVEERHHFHRVFHIFCKTLGIEQDQVPFLNNREQ